MKTETKVYDLETEDMAMPRMLNPSMTIERGVDYEAEHLVVTLENELSLLKEFGDKKKLLLSICRKANEPRASKAIQKFFYFALLKEIQGNEVRLEKGLYLALIRDNLPRVKMDGEFKVAYVQSLLLLFELERNSDISVIMLEIIAYLSKECYFDNESKYEMISSMHSRLYHPDSKIKRNALSIIISLTKNTESDFLIVFESMLERCVESQNKDLILIFLQTLAELDFVVFSTKISKMVIDIVSNAIFSFSKESLNYLLLFLERVVLSFSSISGELAKCIFVFLCKNMRNLHKEIRRRSVDVFCQMELRQVGDDLLMATIQKEKFEDYQTKKKALLQKNAGSAVTSVMQAITKKFSTVESYTEKFVNQTEIKSNSDNVIIGCIHHVLEDELPEVRISAIKAMETLGKILTVEKNQDIKEILLYFLNDDFDRVRIKALQSLYNLFNEISFSDFELDTIHFNLKENLYELRIAIYKLLGNFLPKKSSQVIKILNRLSENIKLYREDAPWIYKTIKKIFDKNKKYHTEILNEMMFTEGANLIQEKDFKDPESIIRIILLSNALKSNTSLVERYPHYFKKHVILLKELYPALIYDVDNDDSNAIMTMKNSILGDDIIRSFLKCLNEQVRGRENLKLMKTLKHTFGTNATSGLNSRLIEMFGFCDKLIRSIKALKLEINAIMPDKQKVLDTLLKLAFTKQSLRITPNLRKYFNLCESFFWVQYLYCKIRSGQIKRRINAARVINVMNALYDSALALSKEDNTGQYSRLVQLLQPLVNTVSHTMLLTNQTLLSLLSSYTADFNIQEFGFYAEDFQQILEDKALLHPRENETEVIEVVPRYPFNFKLYVEADVQVKNFNLDRHSGFHSCKGV